MPVVCALAVAAPTVRPDRAISAAAPKATVFLRFSDIHRSSRRGENGGAKVVATVWAERVAGAWALDAGLVLASPGHDFRWSSPRSPAVLYVTAGGDKRDLTP
ncbi:hypothetical protein GCM10022294_16050 [Dietzia aurantiaca]